MKIFFIIPFIFLTVSCSSDNTIKTCSEQDPIKNLGWLSSKIDELEQMDQEFIKSRYVSQAEYNGLTIFIFGNCCHSCNTVIQAYNCDGELIGRLGCGKDDINFSILEKDIIIWQSPDFQCTESDDFGC
jgi:hypothetical protein